MVEGRNGRRLNKSEREYITEIKRALAERDDLTPGERHLFGMEIQHIQDGTIQLTGPQSFEERLERLRNHFP